LPQIPPGTADADSQRKTSLGQEAIVDRSLAIRTAGRCGTTITDRTRGADFGRLSVGDRRGTDAHLPGGLFLRADRGGVDRTAGLPRQSRRLLGAEQVAP
jgi:hypothetical protein